MHKIMGWPGPMTHRQFLVWMIWLAQEWNQPSRSDHYLMQVAAEVAKVLHKRPNTVKADHFKLKFEIEQRVEIPSAYNEAATMKAVWLSRMTAPITRKIVPQDNAEEGN